MANRIVTTFLPLILFLVLSVSLSTLSLAQDTGCVDNAPKLLLDTSVETNFNFGKSNEVVMLEGTCSQLKSGACGTGTCERGWKCKDTGIQCTCFPPE